MSAPTPTAGLDPIRRAPVGHDELKSQIARLEADQARDAEQLAAQALAAAQVAADAETRPIGEREVFRQIARDLALQLQFLHGLKVRSRS